MNDADHDVYAKAAAFRATSGPMLKQPHLEYLTMINEIDEARNVACQFAPRRT